MPRPRNFREHLKRQKHQWLLGSSGAASDVRILDPSSGKVIEVITARKRRATAALRISSLK